MQTKEQGLVEQGSFLKIKAALHYFTDLINSNLTLALALCVIDDAKGTVETHGFACAFKALFCFPDVDVACKNCPQPESSLQLARLKTVLKQHFASKWLIITIH